jgi:hypothetical protein
VGASRGTIIIWKSSKFLGNLIFQNDFAMSIEFKSLFSDAKWIPTNIYALCTPEGKEEFLSWFHNISMSDEEEWLVVGNFNLLQHLSDRNRPGGNIQEMLKFNEASSNLRLEELQLIGNKFIWTNKQINPLLEKLDWFFASVSWINSFPGSMVKRCLEIYQIIAHASY